MGITPLFGAFITGPFFAKLNIDSLFEYIEMRYETNVVRLIAMTFYLIRSYISCAIFILGPSTAMSLILDLETYESIAIIFTITTVSAVLRRSFGLIYSRHSSWSCS
jgi:Na+/proline symporter